MPQIVRQGDSHLLPSPARRRMGAAMARKSPLDDAQTAAFAWARWRRIMALIGLVTAITIAAALAWLASGEEPVSIHFYVATALGIGATMLLAGALMGLAFLSNGTGHDDSVGED